MNMKMKMMKKLYDENYFKDNVEDFNMIFFKKLNDEDDHILDVYITTKIK